MKIYTPKEAAEVLNITERSVQRKCQQEKVHRKNNRYQITAEVLENWKEKQKQKPKSKKEQVKELNDELQKLTELLKIKDDEISGLKDELKQYNVKPNERIEVFTNEEYMLFEQRLREWYSLQKDIEHKDELFNSEKKSLSELVEHYKNQFEYQKEQSTRILDMHQKLIDTIEKQNIITLQRNAIEAIEKEVIHKENWKPKK